MPASLGLPAVRKISRPTQPEFFVSHIAVIPMGAAINPPNGSSPSGASHQRRHSRVALESGRTLGRSARSSAPSPRLIHTHPSTSHRNRGSVAITPLAKVHQEHRRSVPGANLPPDVGCPGVPGAFLSDVHACRAGNQVSVRHGAQDIAAQRPDNVEPDLVQWLSPIGRAAMSAHDRLLPTPLSMEGFTVLTQGGRIGSPAGTSGEYRSARITMTDNETVIDSFLAAVGADEDGRYVLRAEVLARLVRLLTDLGELRLGLLTGLQNALPRADEDSPVEELKETLTNLIIMQSRTAGREAGVAQNILDLALAGEVQPVVR